MDQMNFRLSKLGKSRIVAWVTLLFFTSQPIIVAAGAIVDGTTQTQVREENGTEVVDIAAAQNGLSHNKYNQFNVGPNGLILNNSSGNYNSQINGQNMMGNINLTGGPARIILNEVTAPNISQLQGKIEVGGNRADVIIANPNGIVGNNFGFINANRVVMTTGTPQMSGDNLTGFQVTGGNIAINGTTGMEAAGSKVELLSRTMQVNAKIQAGEIKAVSGKNDIAYTEAGGAGTTTAVALDEGEVAPIVGVDISSLGGMYANRITLIGTEKGVGVNSGGALTATGGNIDISNDGKITLKDTTATGQVKVTATDSDVTNKGAMTGNQVLVNSNTFTNDGKDAVVSSGSINLNATDQIHNKQGTITTSENLNLNSKSVVNESGIIHTDKNLTITADEVINKRTEFVTQNVVTKTQEIKVISNNLPGGSGITLGDMINGTANTVAKPNYKTIVDVTETTVVTTEILRDSGIGKIEAGQKITINADQLTNDKSDITAGDAIVINADEVTNIGLELQKKTIVEKYTVEKNWNNTPYINLPGMGTGSSGGGIGATSVITTSKGSTQEVESIGMAGGQISAPNSVTITANTITNQTIGSQGAVIRDVIRPLDSTKNYGIPSTSDYTIEAGEDQGYLVNSGLTLTGGTDYLSSDYLLDELRGEIPLDPDTGLPVEVDPHPKRFGDGYYEQELINGQIEYLTNSPLLSGQVDSENQYKSLMDNGLEVATTLKLKVGAPLTKTQQSQLDKDIVWLEERTIEGEKVLVPIVYLSADKQIESGAKIESNVVTLNAGHIQNEGTITSKTTTQLTADTLTNDRGRILGDQLSINVSGDIVNRNGEIHSDNDLVLKTNGSIINETVADDTMKSTGHFSSTNSLSAPGIISSGGNLTLDAKEDIVLTGGGVLAEGDIHIKAGKNVIGDTSVENYNSTQYTGYYVRYVGKFAGRPRDHSRKQQEHVETGALIGAGGNVRIESGEDIRLKGTTIQANDDVLLYSKGSVELTPGQSSFSAQQIGYDVGETESKYRYGASFKWLERFEKYSWHYGIDMVQPEIYAGGKAQIFSENNITLEAANISTLDGIDIVARRDIDILASKDQRWGNANEYPNKGIIRTRYGREYVAPTQLVSDGDINIVAGYLGNFFGADGITPRDSVEFKIHDFEADHQGRLRIQGSAIQSGKRINLQAITDVIIDTINLTMEDYRYEKTKKKSTFSSTKKTKIDHTITNIASGSSIFGDSVNIQAGRDVKISGSEVLAVNDLDITAGNNIDIVAAKNTQDDYHMLKVKKSGVMGGGTFGVFIGQEKTKNTDYSHQEFYTASTVGSLTGNVNINAGKDVTITGSAVQALDKDVNIEGNNVTIESAVAVSDSHNRFEYERTGLTVSVGGGIIDPIKTAYHYSKVSEDAKTDQLKNAAKIKAGFELYNLGDSMANSLKINPTGNFGDIINGSLTISVSAGSQKMSSSQDTIVTTNYNSSVGAAGDVTIKARGEKEGNVDGDVNIRASNVSGENVTIIANHDVNITAGQDSRISQGENSSSGWSAGIDFSPATGAIIPTASMNKGEGENRGDYIENIESKVTAKDKLTIISGNNTNIIGSQVSGDTVKMEVGGDLNVESLKDVDNYHETQENSNITVGWGDIKSPSNGNNQSKSETAPPVSSNPSKPNGGSSTGGATIESGASIIGGLLGADSVNQSGSTQTIDSTYESVNEKAGIFAGSGGFDITVGGNTDLKGAVIVSDAPAEQNIISTDSFTHSDIENEAKWSVANEGTNSNFMKGPDGSPTDHKDSGSTPIQGGDSDKTTSTTKSGVSDGTIEIRGDQKDGATGLDRNPGKENTPLDKTFDKDKALEILEAQQLVGEVGFTVVGKVIQDAGWAKDDPRSLALHGIVGGLIYEMGNGSFEDGFTTAVINKYVTTQLAKRQEELGLTGADLRWISAMLSGSISQGLGGNFNMGAGVGDSATRNNDLTHPYNNDKDKNDMNVREWAISKCDEGDVDCIAKYIALAGWAEDTLSGYSIDNNLLNSTSFDEYIQLAGTYNHSLSLNGLTGDQINNVRGIAWSIAIGGLLGGGVLLSPATVQFADKYIQQGNKYLGQTGPSGDNTVRNMTGGANQAQQLITDLTKALGNGSDKVIPNGFIRTFPDGTILTYRAASLDGTPVIHITNSTMQWLLNQKIHFLP